MGTSDLTSSLPYWQPLASLFAMTWTRFFFFSFFFFPCTGSNGSRVCLQFRVCSVIISCSEKERKPFIVSTLLGWHTTSSGYSCRELQRTCVLKKAHLDVKFNTAVIYSWLHNEQNKKTQRMLECAMRQVGSPAMGAWATIPSVCW